MIAKVATNLRIKKIHDVLWAIKTCRVSLNNLKYIYIKTIRPQFDHGYCKKKTNVNLLKQNLRKNVKKLQLKCGRVLK